MAAPLSRRRCTRTSSTVPLWSTARHNQCFTPEILSTTSAKCHLSPALGTRRRMRAYTGKGVRLINRFLGRGYRARRPNACQCGAQGFLLALIEGCTDYRSTLTLQRRQNLVCGHLADQRKKGGIARLQVLGTLATRTSLLPPEGVRKHPNVIVYCPAIGGWRGEMFCGRRGSAARSVAPSLPG